MPKLPFFKKKRRKESYFKSYYPKEKYGSKEYVVVTQSQIIHGETDSLKVKIEGTVSTKPKIITRIPPPILGAGAHDHYTFFILEEGVKVGYPGVAFIKEGEKVTIFGTVRDKGQIVADRIITEENEYEIQL